MIRWILIAVVAITCTGVAQGKKVAQSIPTSILHNPPHPDIIGFVVASGPNKGKFNPCNSTTYLSMAGMSLDPKPGPPCGQPDTEPIQPFAYFDIRKLGGQHAVSGSALQSILVDKNKSDKLQVLITKNASEDQIFKTFPTLFKTMTIDKPA